MRAGTLRHAVTIQNQTKTPDGIGGYSEEWVDLYTDARAAIWPKKMVEASETGRTVATITHNIRVRYFPDVDETCRVLFGTREFEIKSILNWEERDRYLDLICEEKL